MRASPARPPSPLASRSCGRGRHRSGRPLAGSPERIIDHTMSGSRLPRAGRGPSVCPCCQCPSVAVLCPACRQPIAHVRCRGTRRRSTDRELPESSGEFWIDPLWEYRFAGVSASDRNGTRPIVAIPVPIDEGRGARITINCTRACGATPSHHVPDILAAAWRCLEAGLTEFQLPD